MRRLMTLAILAFAAVVVNAQPHFKVSSNPDILRHYGKILPDRVNIHTFYSAVRKTVEGGQPLRIEVLNMWYAQEGHPIIEIK